MDGVLEVKVYKKEWNLEKIKEESELKKTVLWFSVHKEPIEYQPSFGLQIGWNEPKKLWKPYIIIDLWNVRIDTGWLF